MTVAANPTGTGYTFSGWTAGNASVNGEGKFRMPTAPVIFTGSWTAKKDVSYTVHYYKQGTTEEVSEEEAFPEASGTENHVEENARISEEETVAAKGPTASEEDEWLDSQPRRVAKKPAHEQED